MLTCARMLVAHQSEAVPGRPYRQGRRGEAQVGHGVPRHAPGSRFVHESAGADDGWLD